LFSASGTLSAVGDIEDHGGGIDRNRKPARNTNAERNASFFIDYQGRKFLSHTRGYDKRGRYDLFSCSAQRVGRDWRSSRLSRWKTWM
jgi:hypothetical protein